MVKKKRTQEKEHPIQFETIHSSDWNRDRLHQVLSQFQKKKILVIGDIGLDKYTLGSVQRISPEAPVPIVWVQSEKLKLGLAANVADNIQALGGVPYLIGTLGKDRDADDFRLLLKGGAMDPSFLVVDPSKRTALKERVVSENQQLLRLDYESLHPLGPGVEQNVLKKFKELLPKVDGVIVEDYAKGLFTQNLTRSIFDLAKKADQLITVDPNLKTSLSFYKGATVLTPNTHEAESLSGISIQDLPSLGEAGLKILKLSEARYVVITRGKDGIAIFTKGSSRVHLIPTCARAVYDVSGAGDTVISVLTLALSVSAHIEEAGILSNLAAGLEVGKRGTATVNPQEIRMALFEAVPI